MMRRSFDESSDFHPTLRKRYPPNSVLTSTPKLSINREDAILEECKPLKLSMTNLQRIPELYKGDVNRKVMVWVNREEMAEHEAVLAVHSQDHSRREHGKQTSRLCESIQSEKSRKKDVKNDQSTITQSSHCIDAVHSNNNFSNLLRDESLSESKLRVGEKALNSLKRKKSKRNDVTNTNSFSCEINYNKRSNNLTPKKTRLILQESAVDDNSALSNSFAVGEMYSSSLVHDMEERKMSPIKKKMKSVENPVSIHSSMEDDETCVADDMHFKTSLNETNDTRRRKKGEHKKKPKYSLSSVSMHSDLSAINVFAEKGMQLRAFNNVLNNEDRKKPVKKQIIEKHKKSPVYGFSDMSDNNTGTEEEVHPEVSKYDSCSNEGRKEASKKKRKYSTLPVDESGLLGGRRNKLKKSKKSPIHVCPDKSDNNTVTEEEVHLEVSKDNACNNEGKKECSNKKKKKMHIVFPVDVSDLSNISYCAEDNVPEHSMRLDVECNPKIKRKKNCETPIQDDKENNNNKKLKKHKKSVSVYSDMSDNNICTEEKVHPDVLKDDVCNNDNTHPGTPVEDGKKKKNKLKRKVKEQHKKSLRDLTVDLSGSDTDYCSVDTRPDCSEKQSTSCNVKSLEDDLLEFPSSNDSFHLHIDSGSSDISVQEDRMKSTVLSSPKGSSEDKNSNDYEELLKDALMNKNYLTGHEISKLKNLDVVCHHQVYPLHRIDLLPCKPPKKEDKESLSNFNVKFGRFTEKEDEILLRNWKMFCKEYKFEDPEPFINFEHNHLSMEKRRDFLQYLGKDLHNRPLYLIFHHFVYLFKHQQKGPFTKQEDAFILKTKLRNIPRPYSVLSKVLKRNRQSIYKRFKMLENSYKAEECSSEAECSNTKARDNTNFPKKREKWSKSLAESVVKSLAKIMKLSSIEELRDVKIPNATWQKVEEQIHVPHHKLRQFWNYRLHIQLFAKSPITEREIYRHIIYWLHQQKPSSLKDLSWKDSIDLVPGSTDWFMWEMFRRLRKRYHAEKFKSLKDFIKSLYKNGVKMKKDTFIPRYKVGEDFSLSAFIE